MVIAVASQDREHLTGHVGHCRHFWIYEILEGGIRAKQSLELGPGQAFHDHPRDRAHPLDRVDMLISGGMGAGLVQRLASRRIETVVTADRDPDTAVLAYLSGALRRSEPEPCRHAHDDGPRQCCSERS